MKKTTSAKSQKQSGFLNVIFIVIESDRFLTNSVFALTIIAV